MKKNTILYIIITILLIVIAVGTTYIIMDNKNNEEEVEPNNNQEENNNKEEEPVLKDSVTLKNTYQEGNNIIQEYEIILNSKVNNVTVKYNYQSDAAYNNDIHEIIGTFKEKLENKFNINDILVNTNNNEIQKIKIREKSEIQQTNQSVITFGLRVIKPKLEDYYALNIYNAILGLTPSSKLFRNFREKKSLAYVVMSRYYRFKNIIIIYAGIEKENYEKAKIVVNEELEDIKNGKVTMEEFEAAKESILSNLLEWEDSKLAISKMLFSNLFAYKKDDITLEKMYEKMRNVTLQDVIDVAQKVKLEEIYLLGGATNV